MAGLKHLFQAFLLLFICLPSFHLTFPVSSSFPSFLCVIPCLFACWLASFQYYMSILPTDIHTYPYPPTHLIYIHTDTYLAHLPTSLPTIPYHLPTYHTYLYHHLPTHLPNLHNLPTYLPTYRPTYMHTLHVHTYIRTYIHAYLPYIPTYIYLPTHIHITYVLWW